MHILRNIYGEVVISSIELARLFETSHDEIIKRIINAEVYAGFWETNYFPKEWRYKDEDGNRVLSKFYEVSRKGLTLLALEDLNRKKPGVLEFIVKEFFYDTVFTPEGFGPSFSHDEGRSINLFLEETYIDDPFRSKSAEEVEIEEDERQYELEKQRKESVLNDNIDKHFYEKALSQKGKYNKFPDTPF